MKLQKALMALLLTTSLQSLASANERVEVPIKSILMPQSGFDDNDRVEFVVTGDLPHACMTLGDTEIETLNDAQLRVRQYAWVRTAGPCESGDVSDQSVSYVQEASAGRLSAGTRELLFKNHKGMLQSRSFKVDRALSNRIDNFLYAPVSDVVVDKLMFTNESVSLQIRGVFTSGCEELESPVQWQRQGDTLVVKPVTRFKPAVPCDEMLREYRQTVRIGKLSPGQYLAHVRSRNGKSLNQVFYVVSPNDSHVLK